MSHSNDVPILVYTLPDLPPSDIEEPQDVGCIQQGTEVSVNIKKTFLYLNSTTKQSSMV